jgi:hypothetical protein
LALRFPAPGALNDGRLSPRLATVSPSLDEIAHVAGLAELASLIEAHRAAGERFADACQAEDEMSDAYRKAHGEATAPCLLGDAVNLHLDREECVAFIEERFDAQRKHLEKLARIAPRLPLRRPLLLTLKKPRTSHFWTALLSKRKHVAKPLAGRLQSGNGAPRAMPTMGL